MNAGLYRKWTELVGSGGHLVGQREMVAIKLQQRGLLWLSVILVAGLCFGLGGRMLVWAHDDGADRTDPMHLMSPVASGATPLSTVASAQDGSVVNAPGAPPNIIPQETVQLASPVDGLKISSQRWRRGGLGSNALVTFTLHNANDYPVKDIEISCAFSRRDGSHLTDRARVIHDTVKTNGRKTFAQMHIGFVNVNADRAKCAPVTASRL